MAFRSLPPQELAPIILHSNRNELTVFKVSELFDTSLIHTHRDKQIKLKHSINRAKLISAEQSKLNKSSHPPYIIDDCDVCEVTISFVVI